LIKVPTTDLTAEFSPTELQQLQRALDNAAPQLLALLRLAAQLQPHSQAELCLLPPLFCAGLSAGLNEGLNEDLSTFATATTPDIADTIPVTEDAIVQLPRTPASQHDKVELPLEWPLPSGHPLRVFASLVLKSSKPAQPASVTATSANARSAMLPLIASQLIECLQRAVTAQTHTGAAAPSTTSITLETAERQTLQQERDHYKAMLHSANIGIWQWNLQTGYCYFDARSLAILGWSEVHPLPQPLPLDDWRKLIHPDDNPKVTHELLAHLNGETEEFNCKFRVLHHDGQWRWLKSTGRIECRTASGEPETMSGTHIDISEEMQQQQDIVAARSWLQAMIDSSSDVALISTDRLGTITLFNSGAELLTGYPAHDVIAQLSPADLISPHELELRVQQLGINNTHPNRFFMALVERAKVARSETRQWTFITASGETRQVRLSVSVMRDNQQQVLGYLVVAIDITPIEQLNLALKISEQRHRSMLGNLPGVVYRSQDVPAASIEFMSEEVEKLTGYSAYLFMQQAPSLSVLPEKKLSLLDITLPEDRSMAQQNAHRMLAQQQRFCVEYRIKHKNGTVRWVQELGRAMTNIDGSVAFIDGFIWDITAQREALMALRASEQKLNSLYHVAPVAIALNRLDDGELIQGNPALFSLLQQDSQQPWQLSTGLGIPLTQLRDQLYAQNRLGPVEVTLQLHNGQQVPCMLSSVLIENAERQPQIWSFLQDITERKRVEQLKNQFVSMVSHELRTPLTSISGALGLLCGGAMGEIPRQMQPMLHIARDNSARLTQLINDLLDIDKLVAGKMQFAMHHQDVTQLLQQSLAQNQPYAEQYQSQFMLDASAPAWLWLDAMRFHQIMANLLSNAAKFSPPQSQIWVRVKPLPHEVCIEVQDQGPGIPANFRAYIFQKFSQADTADARSKGGTGLGLAIVKELTERMGGHVNFRDAHPHGSIFSLHFPLFQSEMMALADE
jgi:PAS domain S-box-containing protein